MRALLVILVAALGMIFGGGSWFEFWKFAKDGAQAQRVSYRGVGQASKGREVME